MSYWVPSAILVLVLLVLIAQLPWRSPSRRNDYLRKELDHGHHKNMPNSRSAQSQESQGQNRVVSKP
jgi:hypothetical protein